jgi:hypothetical protein
MYLSSSLFVLHAPPILFFTNFPSPHI